MADSNSSKSSSISGSDYSDFEASMESEHNEGAYEPAGPRDLNHLDEPKIDRESQRRTCGDCQSMWREKENIFCQKVDVVKNKNLEDVTAEQLQAEARCIVQHPALEETGEG
ncbi:hypothetical protein pdam_00008808 [Pocillopora damicornis]|uniref:Uncharacterized protein n=1 Tax=Pocillopora damicornis TaxID=46731 RepID=A0A3M6US33_POCDA|nr:hypothetical protein pdam_00008808 [Pocillopora damicornis]